MDNAPLKGGGNARHALSSRVITTTTSSFKRGEASIMRRCEPPAYTRTIVVYRALHSRVHLTCVIYVDVRYVRQKFKFKDTKIYLILTNSPLYRIYNFTLTTYKLYVFLRTHMTHATLSLHERAWMMRAVPSMITVELLLRCAFVTTGTSAASSQPDSRSICIAGAHCAPYRGSLLAYQERWEGKFFFFIIFGIIISGLSQPRVRFVATDYTSD